ncbi:MAG: lipid A deacylase LpxR family protein [Wenzhouxiangellaceae bacterium]|nr:lipid A deacylase LpxR family protein [Wenzhouxiangellaceae bacterium]
MMNFLERTRRGMASGLHVFIALIWALLLAGNSVDAQTDPNQATWRVMWANDALFGSDNQFSNGFGVAKHSALADSLDQTGGTPAFGKWLARWLLPTGDGLLYREGWSLGHNLQTPDDLKQRDIILDDVPYVSMVGWTNSHIAFDNRRLTGVQTLLGWVGDVTLGEQIQSQAHKVSGANDPKGWDNQLANEPLVNLYVMKKRKFFDNSWMDASGNLDGALGNLFTYGQAALELRFGDRPDGFAYQINTIGHNLDFDGRIHQPGRSYLYSSLILRGTHMVHALPRDGNLLRKNNDAWSNNNQLNAEEWIGQIGLGLHYERARWGAHLTAFFSSSAIEGSRSTRVVDPNNNFASLVFEWQF